MAVRIVSVLKNSDELGYGFTVTGEQPAVLTAIQQGSAAERAGLTAGDLVLEINGENVEDASHETIVALVGRTRNAIQLIIVSNAELTRDSIAAVVEQEQALQMSYYRNRPMASFNQMHSAAGEQAYAQKRSGMAVMGPTMMDVPGGRSLDVNSSATATLTADHRSQHPVAGVDSRDRFRSFGQSDSMPRRRQSHLEAINNGLMPSSDQSAVGAEAGGEMWHPSVPAGMYATGSSGSPGTVSRQSMPPSMPRSVSEHVMQRSQAPTTTPDQKQRSHDTASIGSDISQGSQLAGAERHVYPVQVAYFGSVAMKGDLSEQAERLRVTRDCVSECRKQHRRPQTVTMHISQKNIRLVWSVSGVSETLVISRSAVALTWVDPSDHRVFSLVQRERVYNGSVSSTNSRGGSEKTMVQMKGHVFKVLPNVFDSFQPDGPSPPSEAGNSQSAWPIIRLLKYMYGGKSDRKSGRTSSESGFPHGIKGMPDGLVSEMRRSSTGSPGPHHHHHQHHHQQQQQQQHQHQHQHQYQYQQSQYPSGHPDSMSDGVLRQGVKYGGSLSRAAASTSTLENRGSPESFHSNITPGVSFASPAGQYLRRGSRGSRGSDDLITMEEHLQLGAPNYASTPHRSTQMRVGLHGEHSEWAGKERYYDAGSDIIATHYSPQARRRSSALANRSGSLDSVYDPSSGGKGESAASPHKSNRVAAWAANFQTLLDDPYGVGLFQENLRISYCEENLLFWLAVERYHDISDAEERNRVGLDIYDEFIADMAPRQVNVESRVYRQLKEAKDSGFENTTFDAAQREVFNLMKSDSHRKFITSDAYQQCLYLELDGKPLPDKAGRTGSNLSNDSATDGGSNRHLSTKRKGKNIFGFLKKDKKDKLAEEVGDGGTSTTKQSGLRSMRSEAAGVQLHATQKRRRSTQPDIMAGSLTMSKAARTSMANVYDQMGSTKSAKWSGSLPWRKHSSTVKQRSKLDIRVAPVDHTSGEQNNSFLTSENKVVAPAGSILQQDAAGDDHTDGPSGKQSNGEIMFRITLPDSTSSTVVRAAGDVKLQDAVQSIARRKGLLVDAVDFYEVYDNRSEKMVESSSLVCRLESNNVHIRLVPLISVLMPSGVTEYCRAHKDKSVEDVLMEQLTHHRLTPEAISTYVELKDGGKEPVDPNIGSLSMADRQLVVEVKNPAALLPAEPTSPAPSISSLSSSGSAKRSTSFRFPFGRRKSQPKISRNNSDGGIDTNPCPALDGTQTLPKGFRSSSTSSAGSLSSGLHSAGDRRSMTSPVSEVSTRESSPSKRRVSTTSIVEELANPDSSAHDLFDILDRMQSTRLENQRDSSLSLRKSPMNGSLAAFSVATSPQSQQTPRHSKSSSVSYGSLPRGFHTTSPGDSGFTNSPSVSGRSRLSPSPQPSELSDQTSTDHSIGESGSLQKHPRLKTSVSDGATEETAQTSSLPKSHTQTSGYHSLERRPRSNSMAQMTELRRTSSVANVDSPQKPSSLDRRLRQKLNALKPKSREVSASSLASNSRRDSSGSTRDSPAQEVVVGHNGASSHDSDKGVEPTTSRPARPSSGKAKERPDHVEDFFRSFNPRVRSMV